ncbi:MAG: hypothetical protein KH415_22065 [Clostridium sp.]|jgi:hypothetical protein|nr:hypothetical protein [Clostridium sp.]
MQVVLKKEQKPKVEEIHKFITSLSKEESELFNMFMQGFKHGYGIAKAEEVKH